MSVRPRFSRERGRPPLACEAKPQSLQLAFSWLRFIATLGRSQAIQKAGVGRTHSTARGDGYQLCFFIRGALHLVESPSRKWPGSWPRPSGAPQGAPASHSLRARDYRVIQTGVRPRRQRERRPTRLPERLILSALPAASQVGPFAPAQTKRPAAKGRTRHARPRCRFVVWKGHDLDHHSGLKGHIPRSRVRQGKRSIRPLQLTIEQANTKCLDKQ